MERRAPGGPSPLSLEASLLRQRARRVLGPANLTSIRAHSRAFAVAAACVPSVVIDLGSGGGVPGLILAVEDWDRASLTLLDASRRRCTYLELEVAALGLTDRVEVHWGRAEAVGHGWGRGRADVVVARSFGPPSRVAECAAPLLAVKGALVVSDPPGGGMRWSADGLARLGMEAEATVTVGGFTFTRLRQGDVCGEEFPRPASAQRRRPLF